MITRRDLILPFYLPAFLLAFGGGMLIPTLPLYLKSFGVSFGLVSVATSALGVGLSFGDLPAGTITQRLGLRRAMLVGVCVIGVVMAATGLARVFIQIVFYRFIIGLGTALWNISRHAYITRATAVSERGRALAVFGGVGRMGTFLGPAVGGFIAAHYGLRMPFFVHATITSGMAVLLFLFLREPSSSSRSSKDHQFLGTLLVLRNNVRTLSTAGSAQMFAQMIRAGRSLIIPLYGAYQLGLDPDTLGLIISAAAAIDMVMFYPAGLIMDRWGRKYASVPCFFVLAIGMGLVPLAHSATGLILATALMGLGNGLGSGSMMTLGADLAPKRNVSEFLGAWRLIGDVGSTGGPLIVGYVADLIGLSASAFALSGIGLFAAMTLLLFVPETLERHET